VTGDRAGEGAARRSMAAANQSLGDVGRDLNSSTLQLNLSRF